MKNTPTPVRFKQSELEFLNTAAIETDLPIADLVRRSVRLLKKQRMEARSFAFLMELGHVDSGHAS